jgi:regulator of CtrA degradation
MTKAAHMNRALHARLVESLYIEAMVMADEARYYLGVRGDEDRELLEPVVRIAFSCESLKVTTRLMHVIAWLMAQRGWQRGEISDAELAQDKYRLGEANPTDPAMSRRFPAAARALMDGSSDLYDRVARLQDSMTGQCDGRLGGPARALIDRLESVF